MNIHKLSSFQLLVVVVALGILFQAIPFVRLHLLLGVFNGYVVCIWLYRLFNKIAPEGSKARAGIELAMWIRMLRR